LNSRKLAYFASTVPLALLLSMIPGLGEGLLLYVGVAVWATIGFRYFAAMVVTLSIVNFSQTEALASVATSPGYVQSVNALAANPTYAGDVLGLELMVLVGFGLIIWALKRQIKSLLVKRLGASRLP
jgi:hypothetical protein